MSLDPVYAASSNFSQYLICLAVFLSWQIYHFFHFIYVMYSMLFDCFTEKEKNIPYHARLKCKFIKRKLLVMGTYNFAQEGFHVSIFLLNQQSFSEQCLRGHFQVTASDICNLCICNLSDTTFKWLVRNFLEKLSVEPWAHS